MSRIDQRTYEVVNDWLKSLGVLCAGNMTVEDARTRCGAYTTMLCEAFPVSVFTRKSLADVAEKCKWFPSYAEVVAALGEIRRDSLPVQVRMGGSVSIAQLAAPSFKPTAADCVRVDEQVAALKREFAEDPGGADVRVMPNYLNKLELALSASPSVLASRPDYRAALEMHRSGQEQRA